ncbi:MAG TPA: MFS transporter [Tepidisphaeraceae bacterium]|jgi:MFS family permease
MSTTNLLPVDTLEKKNWWSYLNGYHWFVLIVCALGWMFDCADQMVFTSSRGIAMRDLLPNATSEYQNYIGGWATTAFMVGWATGGLIFGIIGDKWGRAKTMGLTIFLYALFTGLSALSQNWQQFAFSRFVTGFGVGGEFAAGAALVADVMPTQARAQALGLLQALSAVGNIVGAKMLGIVGHWTGNNQHLTWRYLYLVGALPALIAVFVMFKLKEPEKWVAAKAAAKASGDKSMGRIGDLFSNRTWRRHTIIGLSLAIAGVIGVWGIGFYSPELIDSNFPPITEVAGQRIDAIISAPSGTSRVAMVVELETTAKQSVDGKPTPAAAVATDALAAYRQLLGRTIGRSEIDPKDLQAVVVTPKRQGKLAALAAKRMEPKEGTSLKSNALVLQQVGAFFGMLTFSILAVRIGRRYSFVIGFLLAWAGIVVVFLAFHERSQVWYLWPLLGYCTMVPFGGYAVYFPELFPTRLRTTGTGFCYNVGRYVASLGPLAFTSLSAMLVGWFETPAFRVAAVIVASVYVIGIIAAFAGPETMNQPLPEDERTAAH